MSRSRMAWIVAAFVSLIMLACINTGSSTLPAGETAPNFGVKLGNDTVMLEDLRGKVVTVVFWSSG
jgi:hypothetical protein